MSPLRWFPPKTCYKSATRRDTSVQQHSVRSCNRRVTSVYHDAIHACNRHAIVCNDTLRRVRIRRSSRHGGVTKRSSRHGGVTRHSSRYGGVDTCSSRYGGGTNHPFQQDLSITTNTLSERQALPAGFTTSAIRFLTALTLRIRVRAAKITSKLKSAKIFNVFIVLLHYRPTDLV
jgi:hypothetical protein